MQINDADVAELVDARDLKSLDGNIVWVRSPTARTRTRLRAETRAQRACSPTFSSHLHRLGA